MSSRPLLSRAVANRAVANRGVANRAVANRGVANRAVGACATSMLAVLVLAGCVEADPPSGDVFDTPAASQDAETPSADGGSGEVTTAATTKAGNGKDADAPKLPTSTKIVDVELPGSESVAVVAGYGALGQNGVDSFDLSFTKPISGYTLRYVDEVTEDPSGKPVTLQGGATLQLIVRGATTDNTPYVSGDTKPTAFKPSLNFKPRMLAINEVREVGDFEATLSFGIGVTKKLPFRVTLLKNPTRLVIDIKQP